MRDKLEVKILALVAGLLVIGICAAGTMVYLIEKSSLYSLTETSTGVTADVIVKDIERIMLEGKAELVKSLMESLKGVRNVDEIELLRYDGNIAFSQAGKTTPDAGIMKQIVQTKAPVVKKDQKRIVFYRPLENADRCKTCHANDPPVLGAVKLSFSIAKE